MNTVILIGNLTRDPETKYLPSGASVTEFGLAVNKRWVTPDGEKKERTTFIDCKCWGKRGEAFAKFHRKGGRAAFTGEIDSESWDDKATGQKRSKMFVVLADWEFCGSKDDGGNRQEQAPQQQREYTLRPPGSGPMSRPSAPPPGEEDEIPF